MSWGMGSGDGGGDDEDLVHVGGDGPGAAALGHSALEHACGGARRRRCRGARRPGSGSSRTTSPTTTLDVSRLALPRSTARTLPAAVATRYADPSRSSTVPSSGGHHSAGARAIASSSAAFTSYSESAPMRSLGFLRCPAPGQRLGLDVAHRPLAAGRPAHEQQRGAVEAAQVGLLVDVDGHRVGLAVAAAEGRGALVLGHVAAQRQLAHRPGTDSSHDVAEEEGDVGGSLRQPPHEIRIPLRPEGDVDPHAVARLPQAAPGDRAARRRASGTRTGRWRSAPGPTKSRAWAMMASSWVASPG